MTLPTFTPDKRVDTISIKQELAFLFSEYQGLLYWESLKSFLNGKISRAEWDQRAESAIWGSLKDPKLREKAINLHNHLIFSILHNASLPQPQAPNIRHLGFSKRKRNSVTDTLEDTYALRINNSNLLVEGEREPKRRIISSFSKKERERLRKVDVPAIGAPPSEEVDGGLAVAEAGEKKRGEDGKKRKKKGNAVFPPQFAELKMTELASEMKNIPDQQNLHKRMHLVAVENELYPSPEMGVSHLGHIAMETHLRSFLEHLLSASRLQNYSTNPTTGVLELVHPTPTVSGPSASLAQRLDRSEVCLRDLSTLLNVSPHLYVRQSVGAVEKVIMTKEVGEDDDFSSDEDEDWEREEKQEDAVENMSRYVETNSGVWEEGFPFKVDDEMRAAVSMDRKKGVGGKGPSRVPVNGETMGSDGVKRKDYSRWIPRDREVTQGQDQNQNKLLKLAIKNGSMMGSQMGPQMRSQMAKGGVELKEMNGSGRKEIERRMQAELFPELSSSVSTTKIEMTTTTTAARNNGSGNNVTNGGDTDGDSDGEVGEMRRERGGDILKVLHAYVSS